MKIVYLMNTKTNKFSINWDHSHKPLDLIPFHPEDDKKCGNNNILLKGFVSSTVPIILKSEQFFYINQDKQSKKIHSMFGNALTMELIKLSKHTPGPDETNLPPKLQKTVLTTDKQFELYIKGEMTSLALDLDSKQMDGDNITIPVRLTTNTKNAVSLFTTNFIPKDKTSTIDHGEKVVIYTKYIYETYKIVYLILTTNDKGELQFVSEADFNRSIFRFIKYNSTYNPLLEEYHIHDVNQFMQTKHKLSPPFTFSEFQIDETVLIESFLYSFLGVESFLFTFNLANFKFTSFKEIGKHKNRVVNFRSRIYLESLRIKNPFYYTKISKLLFVLNQVSIAREFPLLFNNPDHGMIVQKFCDIISFKYLQNAERALFEFINSSHTVNSLILWTESSLIEISVVLEILASFENESIRPVSILNSVYRLLENQSDINKKKVLEDLFRELSSDLIAELIHLMRYGHCKLSYDYIQKQMDNIARYSIMFWDAYRPLEIDKIPKCLINLYDDILNITKYNTIFNTSTTLKKDKINLELQRKLGEYTYTPMDQFKTFLISLAGVLKNAFKSFCSYNNYLQKGVPYFHNCASLYQGNVLDHFFTDSKEYLIKDINKLQNKDYRLKLESILTKSYSKCANQCLTDYMNDEIKFVIKFDSKLSIQSNKFAYEIMTIQCKVTWPFSALIATHLVNSYSTLSNKILKIKFRLFLLNSISFQTKKEFCLAFSLRGILLGVLEFYYISVNNELFYNTFNKLLLDEQWDVSVTRLDYFGSSLCKKSFMETKFLNKGLSGTYYITDKLIEFKTNEDVLEIDCGLFIKETMRIKEYFNNTINKLLEKSNVQKELKFLSSSISI